MNGQDRDVVKVVVAGALGAVGRKLVAALLSEKQELRLVGAYARRCVGEDVAAAIGVPSCGVRISRTIEEALDSRPDVLIDFTHPSVVRSHISAAFERKINVVIGTTGFFDRDFAAIDAAARAAGVGAATGNFSLTAALLQHFARFAAQHVPNWEIVEYASHRKPDVPSGTARELAELLHRKASPLPQFNPDDVIGPREARGATFGGAQVHSIRLPSFANSLEIVFGLAGERLTIRHDELDKEIFVKGALLAAERVMEITGLVRGLDSLLFGDGR
ncbi:4-hydroxy-tetrahydrodipicolinate reductase [Pseudorhodoplanes sp.]|uniref:4-hydroxy-tetrahydrodipicolinate reductase n=1 Tax=Pseudorhodoplanes sp. TaxID=1934341 RepID=UPI003D0D7C77